MDELTYKMVRSRRGCLCKSNGSNCLCACGMFVAFNSISLQASTKAEADLAEATSSSASMAQRQAELVEELKRANERAAEVCMLCFMTVIRCLSLF